jgi:hypothetical protein
VWLLQELASWRDVTRIGQLGTTLTSNSIKAIFKCVSSLLPKQVNVRLISN